MAENDGKVLDGTRNPLKTGMTSWKITGFNINTYKYIFIYGSFSICHVSFRECRIFVSLGDTSTQSAPMVVFSKHPRSERCTAPKRN